MSFKKENCSNKIIRDYYFAKPNGKKMTIERMILIGEEKLRNIWTHFVKEAKRAIIKITEKDNDAWILLHALNNYGQNP